ncbi:PREDICTED: uncharacterized protein LOC104599490 isoform X1 [Nelumbo nucifera]|nr:PREDICTED: uncharacterized protein LOC104599490 isoform X1 [Nelumbo nucifera]
MAWFYEHTTLFSPSVPDAIPHLFKCGNMGYQWKSKRADFLKKARVETVIEGLNPTSEEMALVDVRSEGCFVDRGGHGMGGEPFYNGEDVDHGWRWPGQKEFCKSCMESMEYQILCTEAEEYNSTRK